jgi:hypothetical protein
LFAAAVGVHPSHPANSLCASAGFSSPLAIFVLYSSILSFSFMMPFCGFSRLHHVGFARCPAFFFFSSTTHPRR